MKYSKNIYISSICFLLLSVIGLISANTDESSVFHTPILFYLAIVFFIVGAIYFYKWYKNKEEKV